MYKLSVMQAVTIEYGAILNVREDSGHLPVIWVDGRQCGHTYWPHGYSRDEATRLAKEMADEEKDRYLGDWEITIRPRDMVSDTLWSDVLDEYVGAGVGSPDQLREWIRRYPQFETDLRDFTAAWVLTSASEVQS